MTRIESGTEHGHWSALLFLWLTPAWLLGVATAIFTLSANYPLFGEAATRVTLAAIGSLTLIGVAAGLGATLLTAIAARFWTRPLDGFALHRALAAGIWSSWLVFESAAFVSDSELGEFLRWAAIAVLIVLPLAIGRRFPTTRTASSRAARRAATGLFLATLVGFATLFLPEQPIATEAGKAAASFAPVFAPLSEPLRAEPPPERLLVIAIDGLGPALLQSVIDAGDAPNIASLRQRGSWGEMETFEPTASPLIWTTIVTGRPHEEHGVTSFATSEYPRLRLTHLRDISPLALARPVLDRIDSERRIPISSRSRRVKALWNLCSEAGISVGVVGWMASWPAEPVNGFVVSDHSFLQNRVMGKLRSARIKEKLSFYTYPEKILRELLPFQTRLADATPDVLESLVRLKPRERDNFKKLMAGGGNRMRWLAFAATKDDFYARSALHLLETRSPQVLFVYLQAVDQFAHHTWKYSTPDADSFGYERRDQTTYRKSMHKIVSWVDDWVGKFVSQLEREGGKSTVLLLSDHGWGRTGEIDGRPTYGHGNAPPGVFAMAGHGIAQAGEVKGVGVFDVAPTLLYWLGLPISDEMRGRVLHELFDSEQLPHHSQRRIATYETGLPHSFAPRTSAEDDTMIENLKALGYIE